VSAARSHLESEIREQPEAIARLLDENGGRMAELARGLRERGVGCVMIAARGSSDNAARYAQYLLGGRLGLPVALAAPSLESLHRAGAVPRREGDVVIGISQSGRSPDVVGVLDAARAVGTPTIAITNDGGSPLAHAADNVIELGVGAERSVAATKTYTASLAVLAALIAELRADDGDRGEVRRIPLLVGQAVDSSFAAVDGLTEWVSASHVVGLSRGYNLATAMEIALKIRELTGTVAEGFSSADLLHGPIAAVTTGTLAVVVAATGRARTSVLETAELLRQRGANTVMIGEAPSADLPLPPYVPEWLSPLVAVVPGQVLAMRLAELAGTDIDAPAGLAKVTETH
jgi:glutamine---fructose-6-phosphate transaminase (isomerizing)